MNLFPLGVTPYLLGGILVGMGTLLVYVFTSYIVGASGILDSMLSCCTSVLDKKFRKQRLLFFAGLISGAFLFALFFEKKMFITSVSPLRLLIGGLFVGFGTRMGRGCTSGHGICGLASLSKTSLINVVIFLGVALIAAQLMMALGVTP